MTTPAQARIKAKAEEIALTNDASIGQLLAELNASRLRGSGEIARAQIQEHHVRWALEWKESAVTYKLRIAVRLVDDGREARIDQILVQKEAWTPYSYEGHTPTTTMKKVAELDVAKIREAVEYLWQR